MCLLLIVAHFLGGGYFTYYLSAHSLGTLSLNLWAVALVVSVVQYFCVVEVLALSVVWIGAVHLATGSALYAACNELRTKAKLILMRSSGNLRQSNSLVQHLNPACRASRKCPELPVSRLLLSINDNDVVPLHPPEERDTLEHITHTLSYSVLWTLMLLFGSVPFTVAVCAVECLSLGVVAAIIYGYYICAQHSLPAAIVIACVTVVGVTAREVYLYHNNDSRHLLYTTEEGHAVDDDTLQGDEVDFPSAAGRLKFKPKPKHEYDVSTAERAAFYADQPMSSGVKVSGLPIGASPDKNLNDEMQQRFERVLRDTEALSLDAGQRKDITANSYIEQQRAKARKAKRVAEKANQLLPFPRGMSPELDGFESDEETLPGFELHLPPDGMVYDSLVSGPHINRPVSAHKDRERDRDRATRPKQKKNRSNGPIYDSGDGMHLGTNALNDFNTKRKGLDGTDVLKPLPSRGGRLLLAPIERPEGVTSPPLMSPHHTLMSSRSPSPNLRIRIPGSTPPEEIQSPPSDTHQTPKVYYSLLHQQRRKAGRKKSMENTSHHDAVTPTVRVHGLSSKEGPGSHAAEERMEYDREKSLSPKKYVHSAVDTQMGFERGEGESGAKRGAKLVRTNSLLLSDTMFIQHDSELPVFDILAAVNDGFVSSHPVGSPTRESFTSPVRHRTTSTQDAITLERTYGADLASGTPTTTGGAVTSVLVGGEHLSLPTEPPREVTVLHTPMNRQQLPSYTRFSTNTQNQHHRRYQQRLRGRTASTESAQTNGQNNNGEDPSNDHYFPARDIERRQEELMRQQGSFGGQITQIDAPPRPGSAVPLVVPRIAHGAEPPSPSGVVRSYQRSGVHPTII
eukprot:gene22586-28721_t